MKKTKVVIGILLIFTAGSLAGSFTTSLILKQRIKQAAFGDRFPLPRIFQRLEAELNLSEDQTQEIDKILQDCQVQLNKAREIYRPEFEQIIDDTFFQLQGKLDPEQKIKLDRLYDNFQQRVQYQPYHSRGPRRMGKKQFPQYSVIKEYLHLTEQQETHVRPLIESYIKQQNMLHRSWRHHQIEIRESYRQKQEDHREHVIRQLHDFLTQEQLAAFEQLITDCPRRMRRSGRLPHF